MKIEITEQEAAYLQPLLWIIYVGLKGEQESDSPKEKIEERKETKELVQSILNKIQSQSLEVGLPPEGAIPVTEQELKAMNINWYKSKDTGNIFSDIPDKFYHDKCVLTSKYMLKLNPNTKCWEEWEDTSNKIPIPSFFDNDDRQILIGDTVDISVQRIHDNYEKIYRGVVMRRGKRYFVKVEGGDYLFEIIDPMLCTVINEKDE